MRVSILSVPVILCTLTGLALYAGEDWSKKDSKQWSAQDVQQILSDSPWTRQTIATFEKHDEEERPENVPNGTPPAGMTGHGGVSDGHWDGGVGRVPRGEPPKLPITVRWDSALPVRLAFAQLHATAGSAPDQPNAAESAQEYVISVTGLVPAFGEHSTRVDPEQMRAGLRNTSRLVPHGKAPIAPTDVKIDSATGEIQLFFPKSDPIRVEDKQVTFKTRFGSLSVAQGFRLKDMVYKGRLEL